MNSVCLFGLGMAQAGLVSLALAQAPDPQAPATSPAVAPGAQAPATSPAVPSDAQPPATSPAVAPAPSAPGAPGTPAAPPPIEEKEVAQATPPPAEKPTQERFRQALAPYGRWVETPEYGLVWVPSGVGPRWRPYAHGRWVYTERGWTFVSYDPWGWAPFHYGRWVFIPGQGWAWIPGYEWAPAWVSWRYGGGYISWAPLGPVGVAVSYYDTPSLWIAVRGPYFYRPLAWRFFVPTARIGVVFRTTYFAGVPRAGVYFSPPVRYVSRLVGRPIVRVQARSVAPYWAKPGAYRPQVALRHAFQRAPVVARPQRVWGPRGRGFGPGGRPKFGPGPRYRPAPRFRPSPGRGSKVHHYRSGRKRR
jgi:hypothetical protein